MSTVFEVKLAGELYRLAKNLTIEGHSVIQAVRLQIQILST